MKKSFLKIIPLTLALTLGSVVQAQSGMGGGAAGTGSSGSDTSGAAGGMGSGASGSGGGMNTTPGSGMGSAPGSAASGTGSTAAGADAAGTSSVKPRPSATERAPVVANENTYPDPKAGSSTPKKPRKALKKQPGKDNTESKSVND